MAFEARATALALSPRQPSLCWIQTPIVGMTLTAGRDQTSDPACVVGYTGHKCGLAGGEPGQAEEEEPRAGGGDAPLMYRGPLHIESRHFAEGALGVTMPSAATSPARHCRRVSRITTSAPTPSSDFRSTSVNISADRRRRNQRRDPVLRPQARCSASCACHSSHAANRASTRASSA
jgi:hypothetical protein